MFNSDESLEQVRCNNVVELPWNSENLIHHKNLSALDFSAIFISFYYIKKKENVFPNLLFLYKSNLNKKF